MLPKLLNKRSSCPALDPATRQIAGPQPNADNRKDGEQTELNPTKNRPGSIKVLSEIRSAIRAIRQTTYNCSDNSNILEWNQRRSSSPNADRKYVSHGVGGMTTPIPLHKSRGLSPKALAKRLRFENFGTSTNATVVLRGSSLRRRTSLQAMPSSPSLPLGDAVSSISSLATDKSSVVGNNSTRKTSVDSRVSQSTSNKASPKRRRSRRHPWSRSSPDAGTLQTIDEGLYQPQPTILTVEKAAGAKVYLETYFNNLLNKPNARATRQQYLESQLYYSPHLDLDEKDVIRRSFYYQETCHSRETRVMRTKSLLSLDRQDLSYAENYDCLKVLGRGSFGVVKLVREKASEAHAFPRQVFAMKIIRKSEMLRSCQEGHLRAERDFLVASEGSNWIVPLVASFDDLTSLYLVMEYMPGGDFLGLLIRENILPESVARFYIAEMILAVEEAHRLKFIHRDIKPDNFLISASGHLKISDFGLAFDGHWSHDLSYYNCQRYSLLGRLGIRVDGDAEDRKKSANISSQIPWLQAMKDILDRHERKSSIGIILYECLYGHTPFFADDGRKQTKSNILIFSFPHRPLISDKCKDLVYRLIQDKELRLCSRRYQMKDRCQVDNRRYMDVFERHVFPDDAEDIKSHRWFKNFPWDRVHAINPPFVPHITSLDDTHYFDESDPFTEPMASSENETVDPTPDHIRWVLRECRPVVQNLAIELIATPYDSARLRSADRRIDRTFNITPEERKTLKTFILEGGKREQRLDEYEIRA
ncbi:kinase domain containing protein [Metarhizium acridum CQMa 102]|uniref:non-specific serine/threonine protein kinase n=1 Tax=Metarhizium acridum (strain CQMa 102) TaxID=655827 RepID=E9E2Y8_METAQ|nr:kinase domain containing protein [Metarhizium acridum CQMa 102]EFY89804.1 kinase domain containing protein [Metarhizium acridum CQMa 102]